MYMFECILSVWVHVCFCFQCLGCPHACIELCMHMYVKSVSRPSIIMRMAVCQVSRATNGEVGAMYIYIYIYTHTHTHICIHPHTHIYMTCIRLCEYVGIIQVKNIRCVCMNVCIHALTFLCMHECKYKHMLCMHECLYTCTHFAVYA